MIIIAEIISNTRSDVIPIDGERGICGARWLPHRRTSPQINLMFHRPAAGFNIKIMTETELRKQADDFASNQLPSPKDNYDFLELESHKVDFLIAKLLGKDPNKCFCDHAPPTRFIENGKEICCECEKPIE